MAKLTVTLPDHQYDVHIASDVYSLFLSEYAEVLESADQIGIIADETVAKLHLPLLQRAVEKSGKSVAVKIVPGGEQCKTPDVYTACQSFLLQQGFTRNSLLLAFGGGACGDLTGFVAATFMRGIRYIQCPTTILAHDSAVGGKTAINMPEGKNMVGAFHQPVGVLFHTDVFATLPPTELRSGMAELLKHALISNEAWTIELMENEQFASPSIEWLSTELLKGIAVKAQIVGEDEFEHGTRKFLNLGHTFGHAVEAASGFGGLSHGECVMIGMAYSLLLSETYGQIDSSFTNRYIAFCKRHGYTFEPLEQFTFEQLMEYMMKDKKASFGKLHFVLLEKIGQPFVREITAEQCKETFEQLKRRVKGDEGV